MNERIKELAEQARKYARDYVAECKHYGYYMEHNEYELRVEQKLAELIVRECANYITDKATIETLLGERLMEHFGVEE